MVYDDGDGDGMRMRIIITNLNTNNCTNDSSNPLNGQKRYIFVFSLKCITGFKHKYTYIEFNSSTKSLTHPHYGVLPVSDKPELTAHRPAQAWKILNAENVPM